MYSLSPIIFMLTLRSSFQVGDIVHVRQDFNWREEDLPWGYSDSIGPDQWEHLGYPRCSNQGNRLSPINVKAKDAKDAVFNNQTRLIAFGNYSAKHVFSPINTGRTFGFKINWAEKSRRLPGLRGGPLESIFMKGQNASFCLDNFHFHWGDSSVSGSEHALNGRRYPLEMQVVYRGCKPFPGLVAIVILFDIATTQEHKDRARDKFNQIMPFVRMMSTRNFTMDQRVKIQLTKFINQEELDRPNYWYQGSATAPPCLGQVYYLVYRRIYYVLQSQMNTFRTITDGACKRMSNNFRPLQIIGERQIYQYIYKP